MILAAGEALVEIMRPRAGLPLDRPATFEGPFASGAPAIYASVAARLDAVNICQERANRPMSSNSPVQ